MKELKLVIVGFGIVGRGLAETLLQKQSQLREELNLKLSVSAICEAEGSLINPRGVNLKNALSCAKKNSFSSHKDFDKKKSLDAMSSVDCDVVLELTPGNIDSGEPGLSHVKKALDSGKHVVTSNKSPLALAFYELNKLALKNKVQLKYEATVGGAIPIIREGLALKRNNVVGGVHGILNGTTNFILDKMFEEGVEYEVALKEAQELGIAESDPSYDLDGIDSAAKVVILANALMGKKVAFKDVSVEGIREVTPESIRLAREHGFVVKLIGDVERLEVSPRLVHKYHPLNVRGSLNAIMLKTDVAGDITFVGRGAGPRETSSALLSDILDIASGV
ncbi:homoserine dehydrogenase [Candidatus Altiarchaeota archaeon]